MSTAGNDFFYLLVLALICVVGILKLYNGSSKIDLWSPLLIVFLTLFYYAVSGPMIAVYTDNTIYRLIDHRPFFETGWKAAILFILSILIGYSFSIHSKNKLLIEPSGDSLKRTGFILLGLGFSLYVLAVGLGAFGQVNFFDGESDLHEGYVGSFRNYFIYGVNFLVVSNVLLVAAWQKKSLNVVWLLLILAFTLSIYTSLAFRYRHVLMIISIGAFYYLHNKKKPRILTGLATVVPLVAIMGFIGLTRNYNEGIDLGRFEKESTFEYVLAGFDESSVFQTTSYLIEEFPQFFDHTRFEMIINTIAFPIPRQVWNSKPDGTYLLQITQLYFGFGQGVAILNYGELYLSFGWLGIIFGGIIWGLVFKRLWVWFKLNQDNTLAQVAFSVSIAFIYVIISRGYLPQVTMLFFFTVLPAFVILRLYKRKFILP